MHAPRYNFVIGTRLVPAAALLVLAPLARAQTASFPDVAAPPAQSAPTVPPPPPPYAAPPVPAPAAPGGAAYPLRPRVGQSYASAPATGPTAVFLPAMLPYREGQEVPPGYRLESTPQHGLVTGGAITLSLGYAAGLVGAATAGFDKGTAWLIAPVIGPFGALASRQNPCPTETVAGHKVVREECIDNALDEALAVVLLAMDGMVQATGLTLTIVGAVSRNHALVRTDVATLTMTPSIGRSGGRLTVNGVF